jgi:hypothetical protein
MALLWLLLLTVAAHAAHVCGTLPTLGNSAPGSADHNSPCLLCVTLQAAILICLVLLTSPPANVNWLPIPQAIGWCHPLRFRRLFVRPPPSF